MLFIINVAVIFFTLLVALFLGLPDQREVRLTRPTLPEVKGIYLTGYTAGLHQRREALFELVERTELNAVVIDIKDASGRIFFDTGISLANEIGSEQIRISDLPALVDNLKKRSIYTIARIVVFQDPYLAQAMPEVALKREGGSIWRDYKGQSWVDPTQRLIWDYNIDLAEEAIRLGFDEVNFDYIRFPSDGNIKQIVYANLDKNTEKSKLMKDFYEYVNKRLQFFPVITSADLFGMVLWRQDGLGIGQRYEDAAPYFDYISPMVYPSHYPDGFEGFTNPAEHPYEIVYRSLIRVEQYKERNFRAKIRPWLQDFDLGAEYTPEMIRLQKQASYDAGGYGWYLWNASNRYTEAGLEPND